MKLGKKEFARYNELMALAKEGKLKPGSRESEELAKLVAMKREGGNGKPRGIGASNDIKWYQGFPDLLKDASNVIFNEVAGTRFEVQGVSSSLDNNLNWIGSGMKINVMPTIGQCRSGNDAFNYQMRQLWLKLHRAYRGVGTYEYSDLGITIFSIMMVFADIARAERIYGVFSKFSVLNRSLPVALLSALEIEPGDIESMALNLADFRYRLNRCIEKAQILCLPKGFSAFDQYITLFSNVFKDSENKRAQWIVYDNPYLIKYNATKHTTGGCVTYGKRSTSGSGVVPKQTLSDLIDDINDQLDVLLNDTDIARMCSDILKAFTENGVTKVISVPEDYTVEPVKDETRLIQLHNTVFTGAVAGTHVPAAIFTEFGTIASVTDTLDIYQIGGSVRHDVGPVSTNPNPFFAITSARFADKSATDTTKMTKWSAGAQSGQYLYGNPALDTWKESVSGDDVVEMTRQTLAFSVKAISGANTIEIDGFSTYIPLSWHVYIATPSMNGIGDRYEHTFYGSNVVNFYDYAGAQTVMYAMSWLSQFDWHFAVDFLSGLGTSANPYIDSFVWDVDNYSLISKTALRRLHDVCTLSLFKLDLQPAASN